MRWPSRLIGAGIAALLGAVVCVPQPGAQAGAVTAATGADQSGAYVGSLACRRCHESEYASWRSTLHVQMTRPIGEATVEGDFRSGTHLEQNGRALTMEMRDGRYFISVSSLGRPAETFEVHYTLGARRFQGYLSRLPDGRIYVLPVFWHNEAKRWVDWKEITPVPDDPAHDLRQIWNITCVNCHATNLAQHFNISTNTYATTWTEMGIGCEACHGPGQAHVERMDEWKRNPSSKLTYSVSAAGDYGPLLRIFSPLSAPPRQVFDMCGYCHGNKNNAFFGFTPGQKAEDYALPFLISEPIPANDPQGEYWPDGRPSRFNRPQALTLTGCFRRGDATCTSCHTAHSARNTHSLKVEVEAPGRGHTKQSDSLCTQCHGATGARDRERAIADNSQPVTGYGAEPAAPRVIADVGAHTHHAPDSQGSRCVECHMSDVNWRLITRRRDHTFQPPVPEMTARFGVPNACTTCHEDKTPEWAASVMDRWYANGDRRRAIVAMSDTIYRAGAGDATALPAVARLAVDRSHGALIRASAAELAGRLIASASAAAAGDPERVPPNGRATPDGPAPPGVGSTIVNSLIGAASDPEPMVRVTAVRALPMVLETPALAVLAARLTDEARLVRVSAAEALLSRGISQLEGPAGRALARAQDEWEESLRTFPDQAGDHTSLGRLLTARGRADEAAKALNEAVVLDPKDPRPHVYLGVLAARTGHYDEALREFKTARTLASVSQQFDRLTLDRLIEAAEKRR